MSSKLLLLKNINHRLLFHQNKLRYRWYLMFYQDLYLPLEHRKFVFFRKGSKLYFNRTKINSRCVLTGRSRAVFNYMKLTRMAFKKLATEGNFPGVRKSSW